VKSVILHPHPQNSLPCTHIVRFQQLTRQRPRVRALGACIYGQMGLVLSSVAQDGKSLTSPIH
jgi:hypothetical protein